MAIDNARYLEFHDCKVTEEGLAYAARVRAAATWLRGRARARLLDFDDRAIRARNEPAWVNATKAVQAFEDRAMQRCPSLRRALVTICSCSECERLDALPMHLQGVPGARQLALVDGALGEAPPMTVARPQRGLEGLGLLDPTAAAVNQPSLF